MIAAAVGVLDRVRAPTAAVAADSATPDTDPTALRTRTALRVAWVLIGAQLLEMLTFSWVIYHRWSNTWDYAIRYQGWWGIAHGNLDPYSSVVQRYFFQDHFELINWPLAPLSLLWPHGLWPLWIQDFMVAGAEIGAVLMVLDVVRRGQWSRRIPAWVAISLVAVMLVANPWIYGSIAFDFHYQSVGAACFALLACREMILGTSRRRLIIFCALCLACGDIAGTYLAAVGLGGVLAGPDQRRRGAALVLAGVVWFGIASLAGGNQGSSLAGHYGYLAGVSVSRSFGIAAFAKALLTHPSRGLRQLASHGLDLWAYVGSAGVIGLFTPYAVLPVLVLIETGLSGGNGLSGTVYQSFGAVIFLIPLSVLALGRFDRYLERRSADRAAMSPGEPVPTEITMAQRHRPRHDAGRGRLFSIAVTGLLGVGAIGWGIIWIPQVPDQWIRVSSATASTLDHVEQLIPPGAEVVASQGIMGRLGDRPWLYAFTGTGVIPLHTQNIYFVIAPNAGIELASVQSAEGALGELAGPLHGRILVDNNGVWLVDVRRPPGVTRLNLPHQYVTLPAWVGRSATGVRVLSGPEADWHMAQISHAPGYVLFGTQWNELPGKYQVTVTIANTAPVNVEVWDSSANVLLSRQKLLPATGFQTNQATFDLADEHPQQVFGGFGPFRFSPVPPPPGDRVEIRVWSPGAGNVSVYDVELQPIGG